MTRRFQIQDVVTGNVVGTYDIPDPALPDGDLGDVRRYRHWEIAYVPADLPAAKREATDRINLFVGNKRRLVLTDIPFQSEVYRDKLSQAQSFAAAGYPVDASLYPFITTEAARRGMTNQALADEIIAVGSAAQSLSVALEAARKGVGADIARAITIDAIQTAELNGYAEIEAIMNTAGF